MAEAIRPRRPTTGMNFQRRTSLLTPCDVHGLPHLMLLVTTALVDFVREKQGTLSER
jgi:hypothetical protein